MEAAYGDAAVASTDFAGDQEGSRRAINAWIAEATRDRIAEMLPAPGLDPATVFALANAIYLEAPWSVPFVPDVTAPAPFTASTARARPST